MLGRPGNESRFHFLAADSPAYFRVVDFSGRESLSCPFNIAITLASEDSGVSPDALEGQPATLRIDNGGGEDPRYVNGVITEFGYAQTGRRFTLYNLRLEPTVSRLRHRSDWRIFQDADVGRIVAQVLKAAGLSDDEYRFTLRERYAQRDYCVQAGESDLDFVHRLIAEEGIWYYFEHAEHGHTLVFADSNAATPPVPGVPQVAYHEPGGLAPEADTISSFARGRAVQTGSVSLRDFDFLRPALDLEVKAVADDHAQLERYDYAGRYTDPKVGGARASVRLQGHRAAREYVRAESDNARLQAGHRFSLKDHPTGGFNREYLVLAVSHKGSQSQALEEEGGLRPAEYCNDVEALPSDVPYKTVYEGLRPLVTGPQPAIVTGPPGEEIYVDEHGRVKVQFQWDRRGRNDEHSSCWIRVSQQWAGAGYGAMALPRIGHEVTVNFLNGDPDRPIVTGRNYHGTNRPPYALPAHKTRTTLKSQTHKGEGFNELRFEDEKGQEEVYLHAQRNLLIETENDKQQSVERDERLEVGRDRRKRVDNDESVSIGRDSRIDIGRHHTAYVGRDSRLRVAGDRRVEIGGRSDTAIGKDSEVRIGRELDIQAKGDIAMISDEQIGLRTGASSLIAEYGGDVTIKGVNITLEASGSILKRSGDVGEN